MHGKARVLRQFVGVRVLSLSHGFDKSSMTAIDAAGHNPAVVCKNMCLSNLPCQYWQLLKGSGCYIEEDILPGFPGSVQYPLTQAQIVEDYEEAVAGEFLQRFCPPSIGEPSVVNLQADLLITSKHGRSWYSWSWILILLSFVSGVIMVVLWTSFPALIASRSRMYSSVHDGEWQKQLSNLQNSEDVQKGVAPPCKSLLVAECG